MICGMANGQEEHAIGVGRLNTHRNHVARAIIKSILLGLCVRLNSGERIGFHVTLAALVGLEVPEANLPLVESNVVKTAGEFGRLQLLGCQLLLDRRQASDVKVDFSLVIRRDAQLGTSARANLEALRNLLRVCLVRLAHRFNAELYYVVVKDRDLNFVPSVV